MICILINKEDFSGVKLSRLLLNAGRRDIKLISAEELVYAPSFSCGFKNGKAFFSIRLTNGFVFSNETVTSVINRIQQLPYSHLQRFTAADQGYVKAELDAVFVFLFAILPNSIFNKSTPAGFCGRQRSAVEWQLLAAESGFETAPVVYQEKLLQTTVPAKERLQSILVFNNSCYGNAVRLFPQAAAYCTQLLQRSGETILEIWFWEQDDALFFADASTQPSLENADSNFIQHVNSVL
jgi:hypothetical protein